MPNVLTTAETNLVTAAKMKKIREIDFVNQFTHGSLEKLVEVLGKNPDDGRYNNVCVHHNGNAPARQCS